MISIDGSHGEGGGQIIRTSVALSAITGKACKIENIRANRKNPGIQAQHLAAIKAVAQICNTDVEAKVGDTKLVFNPGSLGGGHYDIDIGTAGSIALVIQAVALPSIHAKHPTTLKITGGTHVNWSPSIDYMRHVFTYFLEKLGVDIEIETKRYGFYPKGGGVVEVKINPSELKPINLKHRDKLLNHGLISVSSKNLEGVAQRQAEAASKITDFGIKEVAQTESSSPGSCLTCYATYENCRLGASSLGEKGKPAETVGKESAEHLKKVCETGACLDEHMADQILPYLAFTDGIVKVAEVTNHVRTNIWVIEQFLPVKFKIEDNIISRVS